MVVLICLESACYSVLLTLLHNSFACTSYTVHAIVVIQQMEQRDLFTPMAVVILLFYTAGVLWVNAPLDFELRREYYLSVEGARGKASLSDIAMVVINITDINDNPPIFSRGDYSAEIAEDLLPGDTVMQVS